MARSQYIYMLRCGNTGRVAYFTVKREAIDFWRFHSPHGAWGPPDSWDLYRYQDRPSTRVGHPEELQAPVRIPLEEGS